jgi:4-carboxymuconolactone decarboxylase
LAGPFNAWLRSPYLGKQLVDVGTTLRFESSLDRRLLELAIITVAAHWKVEYEWQAHAKYALDAGLGQATIAAIRQGRVPEPQAHDEQVVYNFVRGLLEGQPLKLEIYNDALALVGETGLVELVAVCGYYAVVSFTLNCFDVQLPSGVDRAWS